jgi:hypothetical protein
MTKEYCDRCGKENPLYNAEYSQKFLCFWLKVKILHLCVECHKDVIKYATTKV